MSKILAFYDPHFPYAGDRPDSEALRQLHEHCVVTHAEGLAEMLPHFDVFVHLHGPYFPKDAWTAIMAHLRQGKGMIAAGGAPFKIPVYAQNGQWINEHEQTSYHQQLQIVDTLKVDPAPIGKLVHNPDIPLFQGIESLFTIETTYGIVLHVTKTDDQPGQLGSSGPMDAHIVALLKGVGTSPMQRELSAPAILLENTKGDFSGGRWILINQPLREQFWTAGGPGAIGKWADFVRCGVTELWLKPNYASYDPGERAALTVQGQRLGLHRHDKVQWHFQLRVFKSEQKSTPIWEARVDMELGKQLQFHRIQVPVVIEAGFYVVECEAVSALGETRIVRQGFWGFDAEQLRRGEALNCDRDYFWKEGKPLPIIGMTYMSSDVARKFLLMPNAAVWDRDMAHMKRAGINFIRTGIWTAWRNVMFVDGHAYEEVLRAVDAFILTAKRHDLEVTFNFFAFTPETWEGINPYLDPRSVEAQKRFIAAIVSRHAESSNVHWDLINEPSMFDPKRVFQGPRSSHDRFEHAAFIDFLRNRYGSIRKLQECWNMTPEELPSFEAVKLPESGEISFNTTESLLKKGAPWLDYTLFTMAMHNRWAAELIETIRDIQPKQLVTVGQDEGLNGLRPSPFFYAEAVDYTTVHSWWKMDDLVWDGVFSKTATKPCLVQETGIMYVETPDGRAKRSELELRNILERKYAYAFSTGAAGAVQWIWNINFYMNNINESNIGALRADGTEKPEADVSYDFGAFMGSIRELFVGRQLEDIAVVFPYSNDFSNRRFSIEATTRAIRTLSYDMNVHVRGVGEYHLESFDDYPPKLIIVPSAHNFSDEALNRLIDHITTSGGTLLYTGPIGLDAYWRPVDRMSQQLGAKEVVNVVREEALHLEGTIWPASFGGPRIADTNKQTVDGDSPLDATHVIDVSIGQGRFLWCPLPLELNGRTETLVQLYRHALRIAKVTDELEWLSGGELLGLYGRKLTYAHGCLFVFVSEYSRSVPVTVRDPKTNKTYGFVLEKERSVLFATDTKGELVSVYRPNEVQITVGG